MPQVRRVRFVNVGHNEAYMPDLTLDFRGHGGHPNHTALWLRNGGGKSSIINLLFTVLRPDRRAFVGAKGEGVKRGLEDYIRPNEKSAIIFEWEPDKQDTELFEGDERKILTGVFIEGRQSAAGDDSNLKRFFFACLTSRKEPALTLGGLPLFTTRENGKQLRRTMASFRQEWGDLKNRHPQNSVQSTETQKEWTKILDEFGIDPELYEYQIQMNLREGGSKDLFVFADHKDFVDRLLELVLDPSLGIKTRDNIETFRNELRDRKHQWAPEKALMEQMKNCLAPMADIWAKREALDGETTAAWAEFIFLNAYASRRLESITKEVAQAQIVIDLEQVTAKECRAFAKEKADQAIALTELAARIRYFRLEREHKIAIDVSEQAKKHEGVCTAAIPLYRAIRHETMAIGFRDQLANLMKEHEPLLAQVKDNAAKLANALLHASTAARDRAETLEEGISILKSRLLELNQAITNHRENIASSKTVVNGLQEKIRDHGKRRDVLVHKGYLLPGETGETAANRIGSSLLEIDRDEKDGLAKQSEIARYLEETNSRHKEAGKEEAHFSARFDEESRKFKSAQVKRAAIEASSMLMQVLEVEILDVETLRDSIASDLKDHSRTMGSRIVFNHVEGAENKRSILHLQETGLLPASREVERMMSAAKPNLHGCGFWSGWHYIEKNVSEEKRASVVAAIPEAATGIVARDDDYDKVVAALSATIKPEIPVMVMSQTAFHSREGKHHVQCKVLGPSSRAHFDLKAAETELSSRVAADEVHAGKIARDEKEKLELDAVTFELIGFRKEYPRGWFASQEKRIADLHEKMSAAGDLARSMVEKIQVYEKDLADNRNRQKALIERRHSLEMSMEAVADFIATFEKNLPEWEKTIEEIEAQISSREREIGLASQEITDCDCIVEEKRRQAESERSQAISFEKEIDQVRAYLDGNPISILGRLDELRDRFRSLRDTYEKKVGESGLLQNAEKAEEDARTERGRSRASAAQWTDICETEVEAAAASYSTEDEAEEKRREATSAYSTAQQKSAVIDGDKKHALKHLEKQKTAIYTSKIPPTPLPRDDDQDPEVNEKDAQRYQEEAEASRIAAKEHEDSARGIEMKSQEIMGEAKEITIHGKRLESFGEQMKKFHPAGIGQSTREIPKRLDFGDRIDELGITTNRIEHQHTALDNERKVHVQKLRKTVKDESLGGGKNPIARSLDLTEDRELERHAAQWVHDIDVRLETLDAQLRSIEEHRQLIVLELSSATGMAFTILRLAGNLKLPESIPSIGGSQFLKIDMQVPEDRAIRNDRLLELINDLIDEDDIPDGLELVQRAVHRLAHPIRVRALHPDIYREREYVSVTEYAKRSGGETLTGAILLYCTLMQLRATMQQRAQTTRRTKKTNTLILDNPIGTASRASFLDTQRDVATGMGVQLIYTTAVNDFDALKTFPILVRMKNQSYDKASGNYLIEIDDVSRVVDAVKIGTDNGRGFGTTTSHA